MGFKMQYIVNFRYKNNKYDTLENILRKGQTEEIILENRRK